MNTKAIIKSATDTLARKLGPTGLRIRAKSPEILIATSIVAGVAATITACRATLRSREIIAEASHDIQAIDNAYDKTDPDEATARKKELAKAYVTTGLNVVKEYAPAIALTGLSISSALGSTNILKKRNVALAAAYTALSDGFDNYRKNVVERFGEEVDQELRYNVTTETSTEKIKDPETGKKKKIKHVKKTADISHGSIYAVCYDKLNSTEWRNDALYNRNYLAVQEEYLTKKLRAQGYLFLADAYDALGIERTEASMQVGWLYDPNDPTLDGRVSFCLFENKYADLHQAFLTGREASTWIDFNVDGPILDRFEKYANTNRFRA